MRNVPVSAGPYRLRLPDPDSLLTDSRFELRGRERALRERLPEIELARIGERADHHRIEAGIADQPLGDAERGFVVAADGDRDSLGLTVAVVLERVRRNAVECADDPV